MNLDNLTKEELYRNWLSCQERADKNGQEADYYRQQLVDAHTLLGRVIHQLSERWDNVNLTRYYPTDNLHGKRSVNNPTGAM